MKLVSYNTEGSVGWATIARGPRSGTRPSSPSPYDEGVGRGPGRGAALCSVSHGPLRNCNHGPVFLIRNSDFFRISDFGFRISFGLRHSDFGFTWSFVI